MNLVVTIDTEADQWHVSAGSSPSVENVQHLLALHELFEKYGVCPTYLVDYPVASSTQSVSVLRRLLDRDGCEIGSHCHPWTTPPFGVSGTETISMLCNLPPDVQHRKLESLHETIVKNIKVTPRCFRAGRWGYGPSVAAGIAKLGYIIDTSLTPFMDWSESGGPDFSRVPPFPYRFYPSDIYTPNAQGPMLEIPATVVVASRISFPGLGPLLERFSGPSGAAGKILHTLRLLRRTWLSPEVSAIEQMVALTKILLRNGSPLVNLFFHSSSLHPGLTPYVRSENDRSMFVGRIREYLDFSRSIGLRPIRLSAAFDVLYGPKADNGAYGPRPSPATLTPA